SNLITTTNDSGATIPKPRTSYNDDDRKKVQMNANAKHFLICAINSYDFNRVSSCISAKEMKLAYEMFIMNDNEDIKTILTRFINITKALQALDKIYTNSEMVRKILSFLPRSWMPKVTAIEEAKDLNTLPLEDLLRSLMTHKLSIKNKDDDEEKEKKRRRK
ncbi:UBN2 domain-containing protein, partial [Cephalotus follicularis]